MIRGRDVLLRPVEDADLPLIHRWMNDPEVWRFMDYERLPSLLDVKEDIQRSRADGHPFTIVAEQRPVGRIGLNNFGGRDRRCAFYMFIGEPAFWGRGYARDAVMALLGYAFDRWDLHLVELWTLADNSRAIAMYRKCGFMAEATLRERSYKEGEWVDHVHMSVNREEFRRAQTEWEGTAPTRRAAVLSE